jgi:hypothetical protein
MRRQKKTPPGIPLRTEVYVTAGEWVTCSGPEHHRIARFTKTIHWGDIQDLAHDLADWTQLDADGKQIARLRTVISKWQETAVKLGFDGVDMAIDLGAEITRLRANLEQTNATLVAANRECDRRGQELAAARQNAENREAWIETLNKSYAINMKIVSEARDAARHDADRLRTALTIIADWDRAPITGEWRESLLDIIRSICDCARTALMN